MYGSVHGGNNQYRSGLYQSLMNPLRNQGREGPPMPAGPQPGYISQRHNHRYMHPEKYSNLPPLPQKRPRNGYPPHRGLGLSLESVRPKHSQGPSNMTEMAVQNYYSNQYQQQQRALRRPPSPRTLQRQAFEHQAQLQKAFNLDRMNQMACNMQRNPDLNFYERTSMGLEAMNVDQLRLMKQVPVGTDLYRYKLEQVKEATTTRGEVMKLLEEQRLKQMKKYADLQATRESACLDNRLWSDDMMKNIIHKTIREQVNKNYDMSNEKMGGDYGGGSDGGQGYSDGPVPTYLSE